MDLKQHGKEFISLPTEDPDRELCRNGRIVSSTDQHQQHNKNTVNGLMRKGSGGGKTAAIWNEPVQIKSTLSPQLQQAVQNLSLVYLTLAQTLNPLMVRGAHKMAKDSGRPFLSSTIVLNTEVVKLVGSCLILIISKGLEKFISDLSSAFLKNKRETAKVCVPALIYVVQNNLYFFALKRVEATLFSISYQLRILTTALLSMLLLGRVFSRAQWGALCISLVGVCLVQVASASEKPHATGTAAQNAHAADEQFLGLIIVFVMCWTSAFAGVYLEGVLKQSSCDIWMQNIRLSVITLPFALLTIANDADQIEKNGFLYGWNWLLWTIVLSSASSGLVVAAVMKYADNIKKSYCQSVALGGTALLSILMGDSQFSVSLLAGVSLVIASVFLYTLNPPSKVKSPTPEVPDDDDDLRLLDDVDASSEEEDEDKEAIFEQSRSEVDLLENDGEEKVECGIRSAAVRQQQSAAVAAGKTVTFKLAATKDGGGKEDESMMANNNLLNKSAAEGPTVQAAGNVAHAAKPGAQKAGGGQPVAQMTCGQL